VKLRLLSLINASFAALAEARRGHVNPVLAPQQERGRWPLSSLG